MGMPSNHEPDRGRGSDDSLYWLYDLVPVAEDLDIVEEWDQARNAAQADGELQPVASEPDDEPVDEQAAQPVPDDADDEDGPMTQGQVLGLLEHRLGAARIDSAESAGEC